MTPDPTPPGFGATRDPALHAIISRAEATAQFALRACPFEEAVRRALAAEVLNLKGECLSLGDHIEQLASENERLKEQLRPHVEDPHGYLAVGVFVYRIRDAEAERDDLRRLADELAAALNRCVAIITRAVHEDGAPKVAVDALAKHAALPSAARATPPEPGREGPK